MGIYLDVRRLASLASNIRSNYNNPPFNKQDILDIYPQFSNISDTVVDFYIALANSSLSYDQWGDQWKFGMILYVSHFLALWIQATNGLDKDSPANKILQNSYAVGLVSSKSVGSLSKSYDYSSINDDLKGWAEWKTTVYGRQFATIAKLIGKGGSLIW